MQKTAKKTTKKATGKNTILEQQQCIAMERQWVWSWCQHPSGVYTRLIMSGYEARCRDIREGLLRYFIDCDTRPGDGGQMLQCVTFRGRCISSRGSSALVPQIDPSVPQSVFTITEKAPTRAFSWLKAPSSAFTFKTLLRHYANWVRDAIIIRDGQFG